MLSELILSVEKVTTIKVELVRASIIKIAQESNIQKIRKKLIMPFKLLNGNSVE